MEKLHDEISPNGFENNEGGNKNITWQLVTKRPQNFRRFLPAEWVTNPRPNVWLLTTVESSDYLWRIDAVKTCPAIVHGLSIEPLVSDLPTIHERIHYIEWLIIGGESGVCKDAIRAKRPEWARRVRDAAVSLSIAFFFKQLSNMMPRGDELVYLRSRKEAGCLLDSVEWKEFPCV